MRGYDLVVLNAAGSGHAGGTLEVGAEHIAHKALELVDIKKSHPLPVAERLLTGHCS